MTEQIRATHILHPLPNLPEAANTFSLEHAKEACAFHSMFPEYTTTPLLELDNLALYLVLE